MLTGNSHMLMSDMLIGELLIICASVLGGLLILICTLCCICVCTVKRRSRKSSKASSVGMGSSLDTSVVKLPRVFMDGNRPYDIPMHDKRRWSYVSEPMMDDYVHAETLPLPRPDGTKRGFYNAYQDVLYFFTLFKQP
ncbi:hypothetical protein LOTGIDRAFT_157488 [Lottia gigantea]|uniref:Uncharacterized protein n=1 Tax=Lottia gigantea TaxID=225164 RepID=V4CGS9_LOTGI|nr:hypothetical protein LOTGIDRAFT_157488 [Lottia gigantea]ESP01310.1 hypothetical protein LOTGIDRAFT_157488 [Lottia gigantea]